MALALAGTAPGTAYAQQADTDTKTYTFPYEGQTIELSMANDNSNPLVLDIPGPHPDFWIETASYCYYINFRTEGDKLYISCLNDYYPTPGPQKFRATWYGIDGWEYGTAEFTVNLTDPWLKPAQPPVIQVGEDNRYFYASHSRGAGSTSYIMALVLPASDPAPVYDDPDDWNKPHYFSQLSDLRTPITVSNKPGDYKIYAYVAPDRYNHVDFSEMVCVPVTITASGDPELCVGSLPDDGIIGGDMHAHEYYTDSYEWTKHLQHPVFIKNYSGKYWYTVTYDGSEPDFQTGFVAAADPDDPNTMVFQYPYIPVQTSMKLRVKAALSKDADTGEYSDFLTFEKDIHKILNVTHLHQLVNYFEPYNNDAPDYTVITDDENLPWKDYSYVEFRLQGGLHPYYDRGDGSWMVQYEGMEGKGYPLYITDPDYDPTKVVRTAKLTLLKDVYGEKNAVITLTECEQDGDALEWYYPLDLARSHEELYSSPRAWQYRAVSFPHAHINTYEDGSKEIWAITVTPDNAPQRAILLNPAQNIPIDNKHNVELPESGLYNVYGYMDTAPDQWGYPKAVMVPVGYDLPTGVKEVVAGPASEPDPVYAGGRFILPEGSRVFTLSGIEINPQGTPAPGVYLVRTPGGRTVKLLVK